MQSTKLRGSEILPLGSQDSGAWLLIPGACFGEICPKGSGAKIMAAYLGGGGRQLWVAQ